MTQQEEKYELIEILGVKALFSNSRIGKENMPHGMSGYELRSGDNGYIYTLEPKVAANYAGTVLMVKALDFPDKNDPYLDIQGKINFLGKEMTINTYAAMIETENT